MADQYSPSREITPEARMETLRWGFATTQAIAVAAKLGLADLPKSVEQLAEETKTHAPHCAVYSDF